MIKLESYACGKWQQGEGGETMLNALTGDPVAQVSSKGLDFAAMLEHGQDLDRQAAAEFYHALAAHHCTVNDLEQARDAVRKAIRTWPETRQFILDDLSLEQVWRPEARGIFPDQSFGPSSP